MLLVSAGAMLLSLPSPAFAASMADATEQTEAPEPSQRDSTQGAYAEGREFVFTASGGSSQPNQRREQSASNQPAAPAQAAPPAGAALSAPRAPIGEPYRRDPRNGISAADNAQNAYAHTANQQAPAQPAHGRIRPAADNVFNHLWGTRPSPAAPANASPPARAQPQPPQEVMDTLWNWTYRTPVATPKPFVQAGRGIPGILTYLQTSMNLNINETVRSPAGPLQINGTATLTIDWGDGEVQTGITNPGGPYPQGQLTHHYPNTGQYTITITTTGTLPNFPVTALRAVARPV